jgi:RHH-type proline utilization regulon transcriptional repressor/proline dehydrogenase/delta 1-pyrroline-5-carboxylate dehydrogenase
MLGEAARTLADADRYAEEYRGAIRRIAREAGEGVIRSPGISVKLSALHPRYEALHADEAKAYIMPVLRDLAAAASAANVHLTIDAEESDRLELQMDCLEALVADEALFANGWTGLGMALQAYAKRARPVAEWVVEIARAHRRKLMIRLVKGAYWDSEIKVAQVGGYDDYPVFTRKVATDVSYMACAKVLLGAPDCIYPAFATHNATTIGAIKALAGTTPFEFQRLHGMGEELFEGLVKLERELGQPQTPVRIYAPVGSHKELLAYLVRRLLENGANSSFVNRIADAEIGVEDLIRDPVTQLEALAPRRNPAIPLPGEMFGTARRNSAGCDLTDIAVREPLLRRLAELDRKHWTGGEGRGPKTEIRSPFDHALLVGQVTETSPADLDAMLSRAAAAQGAWDAIGGEARARLLDRTADLFEQHREEFYSLCIREAGKSLPDAVLEVREAVDFLRYYAAEGRRLAKPVHLPGPTGELNELRHHGRGVWTCISPWNFPLAIFTGPVAAALSAGNSAIAKPAEQTPLIGALAVRLMHEAGIPADVVQLAVGDGRIGAALVSHRLTSGVAFTGSTAVARAINRSLAERDGPIVPLIAETGGQNAMIVDSSALPEQVTRDVVASAFQSAGQRCSALRVLFVQEDVADTMLTMIRGAMEALSIGDPRLPTTDVGPVIDAEAKASLDAHVAELRAARQVVAELQLPPNNGSFVAPVIAELPSLAALTDEHFGPVLHVIRWKSGELAKVIDQINATGFGLTLGLQSRIDTVAEQVAAKARVGNLYINRNQIGAVVESQPFGGEGLSGTGPKAGGPHYVARFATERVTCIDTTAAGGNATLMAAID